MEPAIILGSRVVTKTSYKKETLFPMKSSNCSFDEKSYIIDGHPVC